MGILVSVKLNSTSFLIIESRDCIATPKEYSIVVTITDTDTEYFVTFNFNTSIECCVGNYVNSENQYRIKTEIVEKKSSTVIDENITYYPLQGLFLIHTC